MALNDDVNFHLIHIAEQNIEEELSMLARDLDAVSKRAGIHDALVKFSGMGELEPQENNRYFAKAKANMEYGTGTICGDQDITIIAFAPGDGTGSDIDYPTSSMPPSWTPRNHPGIEAEFAYSLGTLWDDRWYPRETHLKQVDKDYASTDLFRPEQEYIHNMLRDDHTTIYPLRRLVMTLDKRPDMDPMTQTGDSGEPHAVVAPQLTYYLLKNRRSKGRRIREFLKHLRVPETHLQFAAFLPFESVHGYHGFNVLEEALRGQNRLTP